MCGIYGYFAFNDESSFSKNEMEQMASVLHHRGPDGTGIYSLDGKAGIGNVRLAILDPEGGDQPFYSEDEKVVLVQNGEIFNFHDLRSELIKAGESFKTNCDTEVLLKLYLKEGISFLDKLNGMFTIAIYHVDDDKLLLARDRIGEKPLYFSSSSECLYFASEIKAFLPYISNEIDFNAIDAFLNLNYIPPPLTGFKNVSHVLPGHYLEITTEGINDVEWWDLSDQSSIDNWDEELWQKEFMTLFKDCVSKRLVSDVPFGAFLSGGVDSSAVVGLMSEILPEPVKTYTIGFPDKRFDESGYADEASVRFGTQHKCEVVDYNIVDEWSDFIYHCDKPHGDVSFMPMRKVASLAAKDVKMVLTGDGADELFAGYEKYDEFISKRKVNSKSGVDFLDDFLSSVELFDKNSRRELWRDEYVDKIDYTVSKRLFDKSLKRVGHFDEINKMLYLEMKFLLSGNNLVKPDRMAMAESLETRAPFLDYRMMEFSFRTPGKFKLFEGDKKHMLKKAVAPLISEALAYRKKQMFTMPIGEWFKSALTEYCHEILLSDSSKLLKFFNSSVVKSIIKEHITGEKNHTREIRALISFELWLRLFH